MEKIVYILMVCFSCLSCVRTEENVFLYTIAVEGWIEEGEVPYVILTQTIPFFSVLDSMAIDDMLIRWAKVSVSDGEQTEILSGRIDHDYMPPFVYRGTYLTGEAGKTYTLRIEYSGRVWEAVTTIPESVPLESLVSEPLKEGDTLRSVMATFNDPVGEKNYYRFMTRVWGKNERYIGSLRGNFDDNLFNGSCMKAPVYQGLDIIRKQNLNFYFHVDDTLSVKFCTMPEFGFRYWTAYENELINGQNPFMPAVKNLPSNIPGGKGIWCGYGKRLYFLPPLRTIPGKGQ